MRKIFKKVSAIAASALMIGLSIGGAAAASFPAPYSASTSSGVAIVSGTGSGVDDTVAVNSISNYLATQVKSGGGVPQGESIKIETGTDKLNIGDNLTDIKTVSLKKGDLPTILSDQTFSNAESEEYDYEQKIDISPLLQYAYFKDSDYNSETPSLGVRIPKNAAVLNYTLDFVKSAEDDTTGVNLDDYEDSSISFLGKTYDIVEGKNQSTGIKLTLMGGAAKDTLDLHGTGTYTSNGNSYNVELTYVDSNDYCKFIVNGEETQKVLKGSTTKLKDGTYIGVGDVDYSTGAVTEIIRCKFYLGADKIVLDDTKEVEINGADVDELRVYFGETDGAPFKWDDMILEWKADKDLFVTDDSSITMPGFGSIKLSGGSLTTSKEELITVRGDSTKEVVLTAPIKSGKATISLLGSNETGGFFNVGGADGGEGLLTSDPSGSTGGGVTSLYYNLTSGKGLNSGHQYFVATYSSGATGSSYLIEVSDADDTNGVDFKDVVSGKTLAENIKNSTTFTIGDSSFTLNDFREDMYVNFSAANSNTYVDRLVTEEGLTIYLPIANSTGTVSTTTTASPYTNISLINNESTNSTSYIIWMEEEDKDGTLTNGKDINVTVSFTASNKVEAKIATAAETSFVGFDMFEDPVDDNYYTAYAMSDLGTKVIYDSDPDEDTVDVVYYGEQVYGNVYVSEESSTISSEGGSMVFTDAEKSSWQSRNVILVGGSCINSATAEVLGVTYPSCESAFTTATGVGSGQYLIQSVGDAFTSGKIALIVAGYTKADTAAAAQRLANLPSTIDTTAGTKYLGVVGTSGESTVSKVA